MYNIDSYEGLGKKLLFKVNVIDIYYYATSCFLILVFNKKQF